jgi:hypothetical protein
MPILPNLASDKIQTEEGIILRSGDNLTLCLNMFLIRISADVYVFVSLHAHKRASWVYGEYGKKNLIDNSSKIKSTQKMILVSPKHF